MKVPNGIGTGAGHDSRDHWTEIARQWRQAGPPLRPSKQDLGFCIDALREWHQHGGVAPRALLLGVTPDFYHLPWPEGTDILAADRSQPMIHIVWPGPKEAVLCADWLALALPDSSRDIVLCDGGLHLLSYPQEQQQLVRILCSLLSDKGLCIFRLFVPPKDRESPDTVLQDLLEGRISNLNILKLRLAMSLQDSAAKGVELKKIWCAIHEITSDLEGLAEKIGWPIEHVLAMNIYRDSTARYSFVTVNQAYDLFCCNSGGFKLRYVHVPSYELGERCPTIVLQRRSNTSDLEPVRTEH
jgi:Methyltransferase domain